MQIDKMAVWLDDDVSVRFGNEPFRVVSRAPLPFRMNFQG
jgi:hypothetical protein